MEMLPVISNSMLHWYPNSSEQMEKNFYEMWEIEGYSRSDVDKFPIAGGFGMGDLLITAKSDEFSVGDVAVWKKDDKIITHRIIEKNGTEYGIVGDQNVEFYTSEEINMSEEEYIRWISEKGYIKWVDEEEFQEKVILAIPKAGIPTLFISCINDKYCGFSCFFDPVCLQSSLKK
jgi:hypothetical protein